MTDANWYGLALIVIAVSLGLAASVVIRWRRHSATRKLIELDTKIRSALTEWNYPDGKDQYLTKPRHRLWLKQHGPLVDELLPVVKILRDGVEVMQARTLTALWTGKEEARTVRNEVWMERQRQSHGELFAHGAGYPLNKDQIDAILYDEHRSLIVAGAGTGKTSTIVAKARWILAQALAKPSDIRILAFNKKAAKEIEERLGRKELGAGVCSTFHALGLDIVAQARGRKPRLTVLDEDIRSMQAFLRKCILDGLKTPMVANRVIEFLAYFRYPEPDPIPIEKSHEANLWADGHDIRSFTGTKLRSNSEAVIANWLTLNSIKWEYEKRYPVDTATIRYGQYHPDFYLPEYGIYIEHWACDRDCQLPQSWSYDEQVAYWEGMVWKRELHRRQTTHLVETYSGINGEKKIIEDLERSLVALGVRPIPLGSDELDALVIADHVIDPVVKLVQNFLKLYRESGASVADLWTRLEREQSTRERTFLNMFEWIHARYVDQLESEGTIDFSDMIREAATALRTNKTQLQLDYLLVDEFQDISRGRAELLKAILEQSPSCRLVAVGDDWQSINRFAGSDIQVMVEFEQEFGDTKRIDLRQTHRFGTKLLAATTTFILKNPQQLRKNLVAAREDEYPAIEILGAEAENRSIPAPLEGAQEGQWDGDHDVGSQSFEANVRAEISGASEDVSGTALRELLLSIAKSSEKASVLVLGRYRFLEQRLSKAWGYPKGLEVEYSTVHGSKGREADYVVILDVVAGRYGFPSEIEDDPIMSLVLAARVGYPNAEERRLFYVALTRARIKAFVLTDVYRRSSFVDELESPEYDGLVIGSGASDRIAQCPVCKGGRLQLRVGGPYGPYYRCSSERCSGKATKCPHCGAGGFIRGESQYTCLFCGKSADNCPNCTHGYLRRIPGGKAKSGKAYPAFEACSTNQANPPYTCYKRNL